MAMDAESWLYPKQDDRADNGQEETGCGIKQKLIAAPWFVVLELILHCALAVYRWLI
jgi:hypothetical protein